MTRFLKVLICSVAAICGHGAAAQESMAQTRTIYERGFDLVGADLAQIFDTTLPACANTAECEAFTFNQTSNSCFPKRDITGFLPFEGAISGRIYPTDPAALAGADARIAELSFLREQDFEAAATLTALSRQPLRNVSLAQQAAWFRAVQTDFPADWLAFAAVAQPENSRITRMALPAYVKAYLRALWPEDRRAAALGMALALEE